MLTQTAKPVGHQREAKAKERDAHGFIRNFALKRISIIAGSTAIFEAIGDFKKRPGFFAATT